MKIFKVVLFARNYEISVRYNNKKIIDTLTEQLSYYPNFPKNESSDIFVSVCEDLSHHKIIKKNPSIHWEIKDGFIAVFPTYKVAFFKKDGKLFIDLAVKPSGNFLMSFLRKMINMEFATRDERIAEILFEGALVPSTLFDKEKSIVHSSGFTKNDRTIIIGGTGGSGKTSLEIELCLNKNYKFLNDDIAVLNNIGEILPNLAHPKIYAYNLVNNKRLGKLIFRNLSIINKLHWHLTNLLFGPASVRRRLFINNNLKFSNESQILTHYFILSREDIENIVIQKIEPDVAASLHVNVIFAEYNLFFNHLYWHEFNSTLDGSDAIIKLSDIKYNLLNNAYSTFKKTNNYIIRIPFHINHREFIENTVQLIEETE